MPNFFNSSTKLRFLYSDINKAFRSMHQSVMTKKYSVREDWALTTIMKLDFKSLQC